MPPPARAGRAELEALLSGEADGNDAYVEINSGAGGTESNDWAGMLLRQAALSFALWTDRDAPVEAMRSALRRELGPETDA